MSKVWIIASGMLAFGKYLDRSIKSLSAEVVDKTLRDGELERDGIEAVFFANSNWGRSEGQYCIRGQVALRDTGIQSVPITNIENACAGGSSALHAASLAIQSGQYDVVLALGVEKIYSDNKSMMLSGFLGGIDVAALPEILDRYLEAEREVGISAVFPKSASRGAKKARAPLDWLRQSATLPKRSWDLFETGMVMGASIGWRNLAGLLSRSGALSIKDQSPFMDIYSLAARQHMKKYGTTIEALATIAAKNHCHGARNPLAQYRFPMTIEEVLADRPLSYPLTRAMCAPIGDGAAAVIVCSDSFLRKNPAARAIQISCSVLVSGRQRDEDDLDIGARAGRIAYEKAGIGPEDIDLAELHDATAFGELHHYETLGFCGSGEGGPFALSGATALGGSKPVNTSGGLESRGHPIAASGLAQIHELVVQLRQEAETRQVPNARVALAQNGGGAIGIEEAAMCVHILKVHDG